MPDLIHYGSGTNAQWFAIQGGAVVGQGAWTGGLGQSETQTVPGSATSLGVLEGVAGWQFFLPGSFDSLGVTALEYGFTSGGMYATFADASGTHQFTATNILGPSNDMIFGNTNSNSVVTHFVIQAVVPAPPKDVSQLFYLGLGTGFTWYALSLVFWLVKWAASGRGVSSR